MLLDLSFHGFSPSASAQLAAKLVGTRHMECPPGLHLARQEKKLASNYSGAEVDEQIIKHVLVTGRLQGSRRKWVEECLLLWDLNTKIIPA